MSDEEEVKLVLINSEKIAALRRWVWRFSFASQVVMRRFVQKIIEIVNASISSLTSASLSASAGSPSSSTSTPYHGGREAESAFFFGGLMTPVIVFFGFASWMLLQGTMMELAVHRGGKLQSFIQSEGGLSLVNQTERDQNANAYKAWKEWKSLNDNFPNKYANFSDYLMKSKSKEARLRSRLLKVSKDTEDMLGQLIVAPAGPPPNYAEDERYELQWTYSYDEKAWPYVGSDRWIDQFPSKTRMYYNSLATFPNGNRTRMHGLVGIYANGTRAWKMAPNPGPIDKFPGGQSVALKDGGFYLNLSNALPLDRDPVDGREDFCKQITYDVHKFDDISVIITFHNEHPSTLLRSVHSVLNYTPPPLLREIILVDDHSNNAPMVAGGMLDQYVKLLPKTKVLRLPQRRGLVMGRLAGARLAKAPIFVVLDSHIEVNPGWLEPLLDRIKQSPKSVVFPQIMALSTTTFDYENGSGIGTFLSFKWMMQERPYFTGKHDNPNPVASPSMAGGLFAVRRDWFFESGAYDEEFSHWGAENVEMGFRVWMCGGRVEGIPCSRTYHIYRHGGSGYSSPPNSLAKNRLRTARIWLDEYYQIATYFTHRPELDIGPLDKMLDLKERLKCKSFDWFLKNVDPNREGQNLTDFGLMGEIRNRKYGQWCIDSLSNKGAGEPYGIYMCHGDLGAQGWFQMLSNGLIHNQMSEYLCLGHKDFKLTSCDQPNEDSHWKFENGLVKWQPPNTDPQCLAMVSDSSDSNRPTKLEFKDCISSTDHEILWEYSTFKPDPNFELPTVSPQYRKSHPL